MRVEDLENFQEFAASMTEIDVARGRADVRVDDDGAHVWIDPAVLAEAARAAGVSPSWTANFDGMRRYADGKGWVDERGWIRAHVVPE